MAGGFGRNPYEKALWRAPQRQRELKELPEKIVLVIEPFLNQRTTEDRLQDILVIYCDMSRRYKGRALQQRMRREVERVRKHNSRTDWLNGSPRNISFDQCLGESSTPVSEWMNLDAYLHRDR